MTGNEFGKIYKLTSFGESHGPAIGGIIQGFPANFNINFLELNNALARRKPGFSAFSTQRKEADTIEFLSGIFEGKTLGTPIAFMIRNQDVKSKDYDSTKDVYRPSHADFTWEKKFGIRDYRGGGRSSARETIARVVAGEFARQYLETFGISFQAFVSQIGPVKMPNSNQSFVQEEIERSEFRCPNKNTSTEMGEYLAKIKLENDSAGGIIHCKIMNLPIGLGEPVFDKLHADLAKAMMSINAVKGFEYGNGFNSASTKGSENNDEFFNENDIIKTKTNFSGGIQGGISNGMEVYFNVAFKPVASISKEQQTVDIQGNSTKISIEGRHDVCVVPRAVPIVESMAAMVVLDHFLAQKLNTN